MNPQKRTLKEGRETFVLLNQATCVLVGMEARFQLRTEPEWFVNWLGVRLMQREGRLWPGNYEGQYVVLETDPITIDAKGDFVLTTIGFLVDYMGKRSAMEFVPLRFHVARGAGDYALVNVSVKNFASLVGELLRELMGATLERWPEAAALLEIDRRDLHFMVDDSTSAKWAQVVSSLEAELRHMAEPKVETERTTPKETKPAKVDDAPSPEEPVDERDIRVPKQPTVLNRWKLTWRLIRGQWREGATYTEMSAWLGRMHPNIPNSPGTLRDIVVAGAAGLLDD